MTNNKLSRKDFLKATALSAVGLTIGVSAKSYGNILGANDRVRFGVIGLNGRGQAHIKAIGSIDNATIEYVCDVDSRLLKLRAGQAEKESGNPVKVLSDARDLLEKKDIDALSIATPDHWHVPLALMGLRAGKHIYVEKPLSHNPREGEWMVQAQKKYSRQKIQMGNQQRSADTSIEAVQLIKEGLIGNAYYGKAWYANNRGSIGNGHTVAPPEELDWDLWQGPAPRISYRDNIVHYNWHWFWNWGVGESGNNALHEIDFCRWALGVDYPIRAGSSGGRYNFRSDDWEFYDTQILNFEYGDTDKKMISWEGLSCNGHKFYNRDRGSIIKGSKGAMIVDRAGYIAYDLDGKVIKEAKESDKKMATESGDAIGFDILTVKHFNNFAEAVRGKEALHSPMVEARKSTLLCHLGNISQKKGRFLNVDPVTGKIVKDSEASKMWDREYQSGWKPEI